MAKRRYVYIAVTIMEVPQRVVGVGLTRESALKAGRLEAGRSILGVRRIPVEQSVYEEVAALEPKPRRSPKFG